jgi:pantoate--beta-alanine ligase
MTIPYASTDASPAPTDPAVPPTVVTDHASLRAHRDALPGPVAVVMTMGALHEGHAALIRAARHRAASVIVTIFLNPLQFGTGEDLSAYPRTIDADLAMCAREGVDLVFHPALDVVYPDGEPQVRVNAGPLGDVLEGASRPGHFDGVLTVVVKLFHLTRPELAYFGQKDAQQLLLITRMVRDLDVDVTVVAVPTVREPDGLALSSRNAYLGAEDRVHALALSRALRAGAAAAESGPEAVRAAADQVLRAATGVEVDYCVLVDPATLAPVDGEYVGEAMLALAARVGPTRLIDNTTVHLAGTGRG